MFLKSFNEKSVMGQEDGLNTCLKAFLLLFFYSCTMLYTSNYTHTSDQMYADSQCPYWLRQMLFCQKGEQWNGVLAELLVSRLFLQEKLDLMNPVEETPDIHTLNCL